jgi:hypothetical protein
LFDNKGNYLDQYGNWSKPSEHWDEAITAAELDQADEVAEGSYDEGDADGS